MSKVSWTHAARRDLVDALDYLVQHNEQAARNFVQTLEQKEALYARSPAMGSVYPELSGDLRSFVVKSYVVFYQEESNGITIVRLIHAARDIPHLLEDHPDIR